MAKTTICKRSATVSFWNAYAPWYKHWMEHNSYHDRIIEVLTAMVEPEWKVMDIGAGNGVLSLPLCAIGYDVTVLEPSIGMRGLLYENAMNRGIDLLKVDERRWEDCPCFKFKDYDLIIACKSLHLIKMGFGKALEKIFQANPRHVYVITELDPPKIKVKWHYGDYKMAF